MHSIFCFVKDFRLKRFKDFVGYFHFGNTEFLVHFASDFRIQIVERGQAVQEDCVVVGKSHHLLVHLIFAQQLNAGFPYAVGLAHRYPNVGIQYVCIFAAFFYIIGKRNGCTGLLCNRFSSLYKVGCGEQILGAACGKVHTHLCAYNHQRIGNIVACIADKGQLNAF